MKNNSTITVKFDVYNLIALLSVVAIVYALWSVKGFLLMVLVAIVISIFADDFVNKLKKRRIPIIISVLIFYLMTLILFFGVILFMVPVIINEVKVLSDLYPNVIGYINFDFITSKLDEVTNVRDLILQAKHVPVANLLSGVGSFFGGVANIVIVFIISFYLSLKDNSIDRVIRVFTPEKYEDKALTVWHNTQKKIGSWFRGQLIIAFLLVIVTYIGLTLMSVPYALLLALLAGLFGFVPYGIFIAVLPTVAIAVIHSGWKAGLFVVIFYIIVQQILDYIIQPILFKKMTGIPPLVVILSLMIGINLFGIAGLIIAIPMALFVLEIIAEIENNKKRKKSITSDINMDK